jgi:thiol-disulfide isomerase/thioredoxin
MSSWFWATFVSASLLSSDAESYADAHRTSLETGKPLVIMVGTDWCMPCQRMRRQVIPQVRRRGVLNRVAFAYVNAECDRALVKKLGATGPVPQLVVYRKTAEGWARQKHVGSKTEEALEKLIEDVVSRNGSTKLARPETPAEAPPPLAEESKSS